MQRLLLALFQDPDREHLWLYGIRLLAFVLILAAIVDKNRGGRRVEGASQQPSCYVAVA